MQIAARIIEAEALEQWKNSVRRMASPHPGYEEASLGTISAVFGNVAFPLVNSFFATRQTEEQDMVAAVEFASRRGVPWVLVALKVKVP